MINFILYLLLLGLVFFVSSRLFSPGIEIKDYNSAIGIAIVFSVLNFLIGWLLQGGVYLLGILTGPLVCVVWLLATFIVNTLLILLTDKMMDDFTVQTLFYAILLSVIITLTSGALRKFFWRNEG